MTGSQTTDVLPGNATGAQAEAPGGAPTGMPTEAPAEASTGAPAEAPTTNNIQKMPVKLCKLITQSHGNNWPSLRDLSGIVTSCVFFHDISVCSIKLLISGNCGAMCLAGSANYFSGLS